MLLCCCHPNPVIDFFSKFSFEPKITIDGLLQFGAIVWIAIAVQKIANRVSRRDTENNLIIRILKEIIERADEVQSLLIGFPLASTTREMIARKIENASANVEMLRSAKKLISHSEYERLVATLSDEILKYESLTNGLAAQNITSIQAVVNQKQANIDLIKACNDAILTISLTEMNRKHP
jgi:hypothetical protein